MTNISPDQRRIEALPDPEGEAIAAATAREYLDVRLRMAHSLRRIERSGAFHLSACASVVEYAARLGIPAADAHVLVNLASTRRAHRLRDASSGTAIPP